MQQNTNLCQPWTSMISSKADGPSREGFNHGPLAATAEFALSPRNAKFMGFLSIRNESYEALQCDVASLGTLLMPPPLASTKMQAICSCYKSLLY